MIINTEKTIDFDIIGKSIASRSLLNFLLSELDNNTNLYDKELIRNIVISLTRGDGNCYYMRPMGEFSIGDNVTLSITFSTRNLASFTFGDDRLLTSFITVDEHYRMGKNDITKINRFSLLNVKIGIQKDVDFICVVITGTISFIEYKNTVISPEEVKDIADMYYYDTDLSGLFPDMESHNTLKNPAKFFKVKDAKLSKDRTIIFWEDGTKTIIKKAGLEKEFDLEKAIMAAFTRRALSFGHTAKERSVEKTISNIAGMITDHAIYEEAKRNKLIEKVVIPKQIDYDKE